MRKLVIALFAVGALAFTAVPAMADHYRSGCSSYRGVPSYGRYHGYRYPAYNTYRVPSYRHPGFYGRYPGNIYNRGYYGRGYNYGRSGVSFGITGAHGGGVYFRF